MAVCGDEGGVGVLSLEVEGDGDGGVFVVGAVEDVDGVVGCGVGDGVGDVLVGVFWCAVPGSLGVVVVDVEGGGCGMEGDGEWGEEEKEGEDGEWSGEWGHGGSLSVGLDSVVFI